MTIIRRRDIPDSDAAVAGAVAHGRLVRIRRGWYATPDTNPQLVRAVAARGQLGCVSALSAHGVWTLPHQLHVAYPRGTDFRPRPGVVGHLCGRLDASLIEPPLEALDRFVRCGSPLEVVIAVDSALNRGHVRRDDVAQVLRRTHRGSRILERIDGRAESGIETIARVRLRARRVKLRTQVEVPGIGRVDLLIGDRLVAELDGQEWHDTASTFESDRRRDAALAVAGYQVMRFTYRRVLDEWPHVEEEILLMLRRGEHRWRARHRRGAG